MLKNQHHVLLHVIMKTERTCSIISEGDNGTTVVESTGHCKIWSFEFDPNVRKTVTRNDGNDKNRMYPIITRVRATARELTEDDHRSRSIFVTLSARLFAAKKQLTIK